MKQLIVFDLDGTLAASKSALDGEMSTLLHDLLGLTQVSVISGGDWPQFEQQLLAKLPTDDRLRNLAILPTCGTKFYRYTTRWELLYAENFSDQERGAILAALHRALATTGLTVAQTWGEQIEDRGSQITFSALGQQAPLPAKEVWDPDFSKRQRIKAVLDTLIPTFSVRLGGTTSIDITKPGIDKGYGIHKLREILGIALPQMLFIGDAVFPGGNDYPAKAAGVATIQVRDPQETQAVIRAIIACWPGDHPA
jgi:HAD superfamily hydrolase (TIGR01484 family)